MINAARKNKVVRWDRVGAFLAILAAVIFIAVPVLYTGMELIVTKIEIANYNSLAIKPEFETDYVLNSFAVLESLQASSHPFVAVMAANKWFVWVPIMIIFGFMPFRILGIFISEIFARKHKVA